MQLIKKNWRPLLLVAMAFGLIVVGSIDKYSSRTPTQSVYQLASVVGDEDEVAVVDQAKIILEVQDTADVGELVRFDVSKSQAESIKWLLIPDYCDFQVYNNGRNAVFSARRPGEYMFIIAAANKGSADVIVHVLTVTGEPLPPPKPIVPSVPRPSEGASVTQWIPYWCAQAGCKKSDSLRLSQSFQNVAATVAAGVNTDPTDIIKATQKANRKALGSSMVLWVPVLKKLQADLAVRAASGQLITPEQHVNTWKEIAEGLRAYAALFDCQQKPLLK